MRRHAAPTKPIPQRLPPRLPPRPDKENASTNPSPRRQTPPRSPAARQAHLKSLLTSIAAQAASDPAQRDRLLTAPDRVLPAALSAAVAARTPVLLQLAALVLARLSVDEAPAAALVRAPHTTVIEAALAPMPPAPSRQDAAALRDACRLAARATRNIAAFSDVNALVVARGSAIVRLLVVRLAAAVIHLHTRSQAPEAVECAAALANFARHGLQFQAYIRKHAGLHALCEAAQQSDDLACKFHACRALAEFSLDQKWLMLLIAEGCAAMMLRIIALSKDDEILSEATRFLGNIATARIGREAVNTAGGVECLVSRVLVTCHASRDSEKSANLMVDLLRTTSNLCVGSKQASQTLINHGGVMAFIEAYGDDDSHGPAEIKTEAFRGLLIVAQGGHGFRASVLREIGIKIRQDTCRGRCTAHLYDLGRRIKVEASAERKDDFPQTISGLGERSKEYLFQAGPLAAESKLAPNSVPDMESPAAGAFRQSARLLSVQRPVPHRVRLERERRERPPRSPVPSPAVVDQPVNGSPRRPRAEDRRAREAHQGGPSALVVTKQRRSPPSPDGAKSSSSSSSDSGNIDHIPRCKVIESKAKKTQGDEGNWVLAVWSAVCNAVTRPPNTQMVENHVDDICEEDGRNSQGEDIYEMGVPLGRGGFATVFLAKNQRNGELVAVKRFHPLNSTTPDARRRAELAARRAMKEQRIWDGLSHKNVVSYRGCFFGENGELNLVAEYIPGWSLADHLSQIHRFPEHMVACITQQIVDGLDYLHKSGITHRDVKPANILVNPDGVIKITDFGVSSAVDVPTMTGNTLVGTPWYIAPEMIEGRPYGKSVDVWSLGCTVMELATGRRPYHNLRPHVALFRMTQDRMPPIPKKLSPVLRDFLKTCWVWDPSERPTPAHLRRHPFLSSVVKPEITNLKNMSRDS